MIEPLVTVIVPVYNTKEEYLTQCVNSILEQNYKNLELILVDDGSEDTCAAFCDALAQSHQEIRVIHQKNCGVSGARNAGIDAAHGEYVCFCDGDDYLHPDYLALLVAGAERYGAPCAACKTQTVTKWLQPEPVMPPEAVLCQGVEIWQKINVGYATNKIYRLSALGDIRFRVGLKILEDTLFSSTALEQFGCCVHVDIPLYFYRKNPSSATAMAKPESYLEAVRVCDELSKNPNVRQDPKVWGWLMCFQGEWIVRYMVALSQGTEPHWKTAVSAAKKDLALRIKPYGQYAESSLVRLTLKLASLPMPLFLMYLQLLRLARGLKRRR